MGKVQLNTILNTMAYPINEAIVALGTTKFDIARRRGDRDGGKESLDLALYTKILVPSMDLIGERQPRLPSSTQLETNMEHHATDKGEKQKDKGKQQEHIYLDRNW